MKSYKSKFFIILRVFVIFRKRKILEDTFIEKLKQQTAIKLLISRNYELESGTIFNLQENKL